MKKNKIHNINETGFKTPKDYFNNLEDGLLSAIKLKETCAHSGFKTPKGYFENIENSVIERASKKEETKVIPLFSKRKLIYISSVAAAVLLLFNISIFDKKSDWDKLDVETVENYILEEDFGSYEIAALLSEEDLIEENFIIHNFNEENIESYLLDNLDIEDLIIE